MPLSDVERETYEWQLWVNDFGTEGQEKLKDSTVLISRCGGLGSPVAYQLAAAGVGHIVLAHAGTIKPSDLNRQLLMTHAKLGTSRVTCAKERLQELNPRLEVTALNSNITQDNAHDLIADVDLVVDCAPLFEERFAMNAACVALGKPMVDAAMYDLDAQLTTLVPGKTPCLRCLIPEEPTAWKREFPVFGAVSGTVGCLAAMEAIKVLGGFGEPLLNRMLTMNLRSMQFSTHSIAVRPNCQCCGPHA